MRIDRLRDNLVREGRQELSALLDERPLQRPRESFFLAGSARWARRRNGCYRRAATGSRLRRRRLRLRAGRGCERLSRGLPFQRLNAAHQIVDDRVALLKLPLEFLGGRLSRSLRSRLVDHDNAECREDATKL